MTWPEAFFYSVCVISPAIAYILATRYGGRR